MRILCTIFLRHMAQLPIFSIHFPQYLKCPHGAQAYERSFFRAYAAARPCARGLACLCLVFDVLEKSLCRRPLGKNAEDGPVYVAMTLRNMVRVRGCRLHRREVSKVPHALKDSVRSLKVSKGRHCS